MNNSDAKNVQIYFMELELILIAFKMHFLGILFFKKNYKFELLIHW